MKKKKMNMVLAIAVALALGMVLMAGCSSQTGNQTAAVDTTNAQQSAVQSSATDTGSVQQSDSQSPAAGSQQSEAQTSAAVSATGPDADGDGIPDDVEKIYGTNPYTADTDGDGQNDAVDQQPLTADNPTNETSVTPLPVSIVDLRVEDNATADHLEMTLKNTGSTTLDSFDVYYTITDKLNGTVESYFVKLDGLSLAAGESKTIHFDNLVDQSGHYYGNPNGLYGTSANGLVFNIELHNAGYQLLDTPVEKDQGVEVAD